MKNRIRKTSYILSILMMTSILLLSSCTVIPNDFQIPVYEQKQEVYETLEIKRDDLTEVYQLKVDLTVGSYPITYSYTEPEMCTYKFDTIDGHIEVNQLLAVFTDREIENEIRLAKEDLELKQILYEQLFEQHNGNEEGYYAYMLAKLDVDEAQYNLDKVLEKADELNKRSPLEGRMTRVSESVTFEKDEFGNNIKTTSITFTITINTYNFMMSVMNTRVSEVMLGQDLSKGDIIEIYDVNGDIHETVVTAIIADSSIDYRTGRTVYTGYVFLELIEKPDIDYREIFKYALFHDVVLRRLNNVITVSQTRVYRNNDDEPYVYVLRDNVKSVRYVKLGDKWRDSEYIITDGLEEGDLLIIGIYLH